MIKPEHLLEGKLYGVAHNKMSPCVHFQRHIWTDGERNELIDILEHNNTRDVDCWFLAVYNRDTQRWEIMEEPDTKSRYSLFSED